MKFLKYSSGILFLVLCTFTMLFLHTFMKEEYPYTYIDWEQMNQVAEDGTLIPLDTFVPEKDVQYVFTTKLKKVPLCRLLIFEASGAEICVTLEDRELYSSFAETLSGAVDMIQAQIPLPDDAAGKTLTMSYRFLGGENFLFPPMPRIATTTGINAFNMAYANRYGIPAGAFGVLFLLICGLFLLRLAFGKPDYTLPVLGLAAAVLMIFQISIGCGYEFLPPAIYKIFTWSGLWFIPSVCLLAYLILNRDSSFRKHFGYISLCSAVILFAAYLISLARGSYLSRYINGEVLALFQNGTYTGIIYWLTVYLTVVCSAIASYNVVRTFAQMQSETQLLQLKNSLLHENFHIMECSTHQTAAARHELKHNITALTLLYKKGDMQGLGKMLSELDQQQASLTQMQFTDHMVLNTLLQNAAAHAAEDEIRFEANVLVPAELNIDTRDLCCLIMNMLDNAIEASLKIEEKNKRFIHFHAELKQGFLAIGCINSCIGSLIIEQDGIPQSTKSDSNIHGFGLKQMNAVARKYHSILDITYTDTTFTVQTALKINQSS